MTKKSKPSIRYYSWEGDACRVHEDEMGKLTADIYRSGKGHLPVSANEVMFSSRKISESEYKEIVLEEIELNRANIVKNNA